MQMTTPTAAATFVHQTYRIFDWKHAETILLTHYPDPYTEVLNVLSQFRLHQADILAQGGQKSPMSKGIETPLSYLGWRRKDFDIQVFVNGEQHFTHLRKADHVKDRIALEIEWNSKNSFFDRDLDNFRLLHQLDLISVGIIITRSDELQTIFKQLQETHQLKTPKYGTTTTQMSKLVQKIKAGGGAGCPILVFGITPSVYIAQDEEV